MKKKGLKRLMPYVQIARPDHWFKNIFMIPGVILAFYETPVPVTVPLVFSLLMALVSTCLIASSNYTINEILDAPQDKLHPVKRHRAVPSGQINLKIAYAQWVLLAILGLFVGWWVNLYFFLSVLSLLIMGMFYNIPPFRLKNLPYLDVLSESVNNPIRLFLGWFVINAVYPPTLSLIMAYWMIGAFFMAIKRYAEYKRIGDARIAAEYRKSFSYYNEYRLILSIVYYASAFSFFFGIFIVRYRMELILSVPFLAGFIPVYMRLAFWEDSPAQYPEHLYKQRGLVVYTFCCLTLILVLLMVDIPVIKQIFRPLAWQTSN